MILGSKEQKEIRQRLIDEIELDLIGPRKGKTYEERQNEILPGNRNPKNEYVAGVLYPGNWEVEDEDKLVEDGGDTDEEDNTDSNVANDKLFKPSSFGLTCRLAPETKEIKCIIEYGTYQALKDKETKYTTFQRTPKTETFTIPIVVGSKEIKFKDNSNFCINYTLIKEKSSNEEEYVVLDFYVINNTEPKQKNNYIDFIFQPKIFLESVNDEYCFIQDRTGIRQEYFPANDHHLDILFKDKVSFGKGHLCSLSWEKENIKHRQNVFTINKINTSFIPQETSDFIEPSISSEKLNSSIHMSKLGSCKNKNELRVMLEPLIDEYAKWVNETKTKVEKSEKFDAKDREIILLKTKETDIVIQRMRDGIDLLESDEKAFDSFKFANNSIAWQQVHYKWAASNAEKGEVEGRAPKEPVYEGVKPTWYLFQIAFILMNLESIANPNSTYRETVDLLWFPTGGGKTEAYLGLVAFTLAYRRLRGANDAGEITSESLGTAVIMRYTLRLLTVQQFQRAATLMCACEKLRLEDTPKWGEVPFQVGLWVGASVTPNTRNEAKSQQWKLRNSKEKSLTSIKTKNPYILINCPWCGKELKYSDGSVCGQPQQWRLFCSRGGSSACLFSKHLEDDPDVSIPVVLVDDDIYSRCPSLIIATVDKFAQIAWKPEVKSIFGKVSHHCEQHGFFDRAISDDSHKHNNKKPDPVKLLPPEMIIQDELHLISGPLGTLTGLYETAIEYLCNNGDIKPKIIASTATTRAAEDQIRTLFARDRTRVFPPQIATFGETFFSRVNHDKAGKAYVGVLATGKSGLTVLAKVSAVILRRIRQFEEDKEYEKEDLDPYFTLVTYFNSQRELGGASMNFKDSVPNFIQQIQNNFDDSPVLPPITENGMELTVEESEKVEGTTPEAQSEEEKKQETKRKKALRPYQFSELITDELTSRKSAGEIPEVLRGLNEGISKIKPNEDKTSEGQPIDLLMATNMLQVGVDIPRLGVMIVNGQPKNNSEYIQATGRIGRRNPGLIITLYSYTKPRDLSYYENFKDYHSTYYKNVETVALTPFTLRSRKIGLFGIIVGMLRMAAEGNYSLSKNKDASKFDQRNQDQIKLVEKLKATIQNRVDLVDSVESSSALTNVTNLLDRWTKEIRRYGDILRYREPYHPKLSTRQLERHMYLLQSDSSSTRQLIPTPISLRNAEQEQGFRYVTSDKNSDEDNDNE